MGSYTILARNVWSVHARRNIDTVRIILYLKIAKITDE